MHAFPHHYEVSAKAGVDGDVHLEKAGLPPLESAAPAEFDGPGNRWSPETLMVAAVADCFILTFRAIATASKFSWHSLECRVEGTLDRVGGTTQFSGFSVEAKLRVPPQTDRQRAGRLMEKAEENCLVTASLKAPVTLRWAVEEAS